MILITGATGTVGSAVLRLLSTKNVPVRAMSRTPERVPGGVRGDFEDAESLRAALDGVSTVFLLSAPGGSIPQHDLALLDAAQDETKVVKLSAIGTGEPGFEFTSAWHLPGEQALQESGRDWTILRPSTYFSNTFDWADRIRAGEPIPNMMGNGLNGAVDPRDVAAVAVEALLTTEHNKQVYTLTGPELLSVPDQVRQLGVTLGRDLQTQDIEAPGFDFIKGGGNANLTDDVQRVLSRRPGTFKAWAQDHRAAFV